MMVYDQIFDPVCQGESSDDSKIDLKLQGYHADYFFSTGVHRQSDF